MISSPECRSLDEQLGLGTVLINSSLAERNLFCNESWSWLHIIEKTRTQIATKMERITGVHKDFEVCAMTPLPQSS